MPDFSALLQAPSGTSKRPSALPVGDYPGVVKSFELREADPSKDYTTIIRFYVVPTGWPDDVPEEDRLDNGVPIELSKRQLRRDFYDHRLFDLDEFLKSCGVEPDGTRYVELLPRTIGAQVTIEVQQYINQRTNEPGNQVGRLFGQHPV
jgi:hypothetical protein